ncbi:hypothetical protein BV22DRAFT_121692 [Leucogyrophana mollusca]|uniref:Uncharacterized protein n=1 Tax=Leucogyrophana mollusca TaxID=85980 RepID=A0ACB8BY26_9AGAM|nr:hypothetical protein BV22DRAFT_121692 [Leucogyrophana mollusca]
MTPSLLLTPFRKTQDRYTGLTVSNSVETRVLDDWCRCDVSGLHWDCTLLQAPVAPRYSHLVSVGNYPYGCPHRRPLLRAINRLCPLDVKAWSCCRFYDCSPMANRSKVVSDRARLHSANVIVMEKTAVLFHRTAFWFWHLDSGDLTVIASG